MLLLGTWQFQRKVHQQEFISRRANLDFYLFEEGLLKKDYY